MNQVSRDPEVGGRRPARNPCARGALAALVALGILAGLLGGCRQPNVYVVRIWRLTYWPDTLTVPVGATVKWVNDGQTAHTSTSYLGVWDSRPLNPGQSYSFTFTKPGDYPYYCMIHPYMTGKVIVRKE